MRLGLTWILRVEEGDPQVVEGLWGVGRDLERILERRDSLVPLFAHNKRTPKVAVGQVVRGIEGDCRTIELNSLIQVGVKQLGGLGGAIAPAERDLPGSGHRIDGQ